MEKKKETILDLRKRPDGNLCLNQTDCDVYERGGGIFLLSILLK